MGSRWAAAGEFNLRLRANGEVRCCARTRGGAQVLWVVVVVECTPSTLTFNLTDCSASPYRINSPDAGLGPLHLLDGVHVSLSDPGSLKRIPSGELKMSAAEEAAFLLSSPAMRAVRAMAVLALLKSSTPTIRGPYISHKRRRRNRLLWSDHVQTLPTGIFRRMYRMSEGCFDILLGRIKGGLIPSRTVIRLKPWIQV